MWKDEILEEIYRIREAAEERVLAVDLVEVSPEEVQKALFGF